MLRWRAESGKLVLYLVGDVDADARAHLDSAATVAEEERELVVDLSEVNFIDVAGLHELDQLTNVGVVFRAPTPATARLIGLTRIRLPLTEEAVGP